MLLNHFAPCYFVLRGDLLSLARLSPLMCVYIYIFAVKLLTGPRLGVFNGY